MSKRKHKDHPSRPVEHEDARPWPVHVIRWLSYCALATVLIADNGSPTVSSLSKISFFQLFTGMAAALWLALAITNKRYRPNWRNPVMLGSTIFLVLSSLSLITSVDAYRSFWSNVYRLTGTFNYLHYWFWMLALSTTHRGWKEWRPILWVTTGISVLVNGIGISKWLVSDAGRITSTIDNALYLADFALISSFVSGILIAKSKDYWIKALAGATLFINAFATILTGSRSTAAALALGLAAVTVWLVITKAPPRRRPVAIAALIALTLISLASFLYLRSDSGKTLAEKMPYSIQRIVLTSDFGGDRAALAQIAFSALRERPLLGWGSEHFDIAFENNYGPVGVDAYLPEMWYDRAHNQYLDVLVMNGIVGFTGYIAFWMLTMLMLVRRLIRKEGTSPDADFIGLTAVVCYAAALIFSFDLPGPMTWQWLLLAYLASSESKTLDPEPSGDANVNGLAYTLLIVVFLMELVFSIKPYLQARSMEAGCRIAQPNTEQALVLWKDALRSRTYATPELRFRVLGCISDALSGPATNEVKKEAFEFVNQQMDRAVSARPYDYKTLLAAGWIKLTAKKIGIDELNVANDYFNEAVAINPTKPRAYELMADLASLRGDNLLKAELLLQAAELAGNAGESARFFARSATYYARSGMPHQAIITYERALERHQPTALENNTVLPAISESLGEETEIPQSLIEAADLAVEKYGDASHHAARLRIFLAASDVDRGRLMSAFAETQRAFPELAALMADRFNE